MSNVWVVHDRGGMDYSAAAKFGEIRYLISADTRVNVFDFRGAYQDFVQKLTEGGARRGDHLLLVGAMSLNVVAAFAFAAVTGGSVSCLVFQANRDAYEECHITVPGPWPTAIAG